MVLSVVGEVTSMPQRIPVVTDIVASITQKLDETSASQFDKHFDSICNAVSRGLSNASTCRMACWLLNVIVKTQSLNFLISAPFLTSNIFPNGSSGPCVLTDTSLLLLTGALLCDCWKQTQAFEGFALKTINWLKLFWTLRKFKHEDFSEC